MASTFALTEAAVPYGINTLAAQMDYSALLGVVAGSSYGPAPSLGYFNSLAPILLRTNFVSGFHLDISGWASTTAFVVASVDLLSPSDEVLMRFEGDQVNRQTISLSNLSLDFMQGDVRAVGNAADNVFRLDDLTRSALVTGGGGWDVVDATNFDGGPYAATKAEILGVTQQGGTLVGVWYGLTPEITMELRDVDRVLGTGWAVDFGLGGHAAQAYRLYQAAFDRVPDAGGLGFHIHDLDRGVSLADAAAHFIESPEFQSTYGNTSDTQFIQLLYQHVLHRDAEAEGLQFHLGEFAHGETRAEMLTHFSESPENQVNVVGAIQNGILYTPFV